MTYKHQGRQLGLWFTEEPGTQDKGAELGFLSTNSSHPSFTDLSCSQGTHVSLHLPHPWGHRAIRRSMLQASERKPRGGGWNSHEGSQCPTREDGYFEHTCECAYSCIQGCVARDTMRRLRWPWPQSSTAPTEPAELMKEKAFLKDTWSALPCQFFKQECALKKRPGLGTQRTQERNELMGSTST